MATPGPAAGNTKPPKEKKELTEEQKKLYGMLGVMGVLSLVVAGIYVPPMLSSSSTPDLPPPAETAATETTNTGEPPPGDPSAATPADGTAPPAGAPAVAPVSGTSTGPVPIIRHRPDPFEPFYTPVVVPDPTPTPIPPVVIPAPLPAVVLPSPNRRLSPVAIAGPSQRARQDPYVLSSLPPVRMGHLNNTRSIPQTQSAFRRVTGQTGSARVADASPSYDKRLSGVIIGDGIRALLEINNGEEIVTRVVQPGDEVDGISILSIQRVTEGNRPVTRMLIRENNQERYVDLKPAPQRTTTEPGAGGEGG